MEKSFSSFKMLPGVVSLILCSLFPGCYQTASEEESLLESKSNLSIVTRSVSGNSLQYPLSVFAFDSDGNCKVEKVVEESTESVKLNLQKGNYRITVVSGLQDYSIPTQKTNSSLISTKEDNFSLVPLSMGHADLTISGSSTATIQMYLQVACVEVSLSGLPEDVLSVSVAFSKQYSKLKLDGSFEDPDISYISCTEKEGVWSTDKFYLFPGESGNTTVLSIMITDESGTETYGYTLKDGLKAGYPYVLNGSFTTGFSLNGTIVSSGWNDEIVLDFSFGPGINETGTNDEVQSSDFISVSSIPEVCSIWEGHVVALVENETASEADLLLLSLDEWNKVASSNSTTNPLDAKNIAEAYYESNISGWSIPTRAEATALKTKYAGDNLQYINNVLQGSGELLTDIEDNGSNARYLCEDAGLTFTLKGGSTSITQAGSSTKYRLRLVKRVHVSITTPSR